MDLIVPMIIISLLLSFGFLGAFFWAARRKQFDDLVTPSWRAVFDDEFKSNKEGEQNATQL